MQGKKKESILKYLDTLSLASVLLYLSRGSQCKGISANLDYISQGTDNFFSAWFFPGAWFCSNINDFSGQGQFFNLNWVC